MNHRRINPPDPNHRVLILGLGSPHGDDQAGWLVIEALQRRGVSSHTAAALRTPDELWHCCTADRELILCDACVATDKSGLGAAGIVRRWIWPETALPCRRNGTHDLRLAEILALGRTLDLCPNNVVIWTITGSRFEPGEEISQSVREATLQLADTLYEEYCCA